MKVYIDEVSGEVLVEKPLSRTVDSAPHNIPSMRVSFPGYDFLTIEIADDDRHKSTESFW